MNSVSLVGRLTKDPAVSTTKAGKSYVRFNIGTLERIRRRREPRLPISFLVSHGRRLLTLLHSMLRRVLLLKWSDAFRLEVTRRMDSVFTRLMSSSTVSSSLAQRLRMSRRVVPPVRQLVPAGL